MWIRRFLLCGVFSLFVGSRAENLCPSSDDESILQRDKIYTYRFRSEALAQAVGTTDDHSKIELECDAHISHDEDCSYLLQLKECAVTAAGGQPGAQTAWIDHQPLPDLAKYPIGFSLIKGEINEVRAHDEDPLPYINIKRGVLSAFVFKMSQMDRAVYESHTDIHGTCPVSSVPYSKEDKVKTSKEMLSCHFPSRPDWQFSPWSLFWNMSFIQHVINSTTDCVYKIDSKERSIEHLTCKERHAIMLESTHSTTTAVQTNVDYQLHFVKSEIQSSKPNSPDLTRKTGIQYEYEETPVPQSSPPNFLTIAEKMLSDLVLDSLDEIRLFTIPQFTDFVAWLRAADDLGPLVERVRSCGFLSTESSCDQKIKDLAHSYLSDALVQCNSLPCAKALTDMAKTDDLTPRYLSYLYYFWSFTHHSKPGFISNFQEMCRVKNSDQCWISLGSFINRTMSRSDNLDDRILQEVREVAMYYKSRIGEECEVTENSEKHFTDCLVFIKAASNMGKHYVKFIPEGINQLLEIAANEHSPTVVRTTALEAIKDICDVEKADELPMVYDKLLPLFKNETLPNTVRLLSFNLLIDFSEGHNFEEHLLKVLKDDQNTEVKYYVADGLNTLRYDFRFDARRHKFIDSLNDLLRENNLSLEWILYQTKGKSKYTSHNIFLNLPFMPDNMKRYGLKLRDSFIYDSHIFPTLFSEESVLQLFGQFLPATKLGTYLEGFEELLLAYQKNLKEMDGKPASLSKTFDAIMKTLEEFGQNVLPEGSLRNFDENILSNVKKLHELYWTHHKKLEPYAKAYMDLFGSTAKHYVYDGKQSPLSNNQLGSSIHSLMRNLAEGVTYNTTRVVRVIEAYHQVPTMMGLPLNWTTNATLAYSIKASLKYHLNTEDDHSHAKGFFQPSAALTFLNRMVLDFPTITQIGVQANSSGYTSTEFKAQYTSVKGKQTLRFDRPSRTQRVLQLFRTNQLIKHNDYIDIPDWDIERVSSSWCSKDDVNSAGGLKFCISKSYPNVTHRIKPWALMAGWCKWELLVHPANEHAAHYDFELHQALKHKMKEFNAKFSVTEKEKEKAARFKVIIDESGKDLKLELKTSLLPDFSASLSRSEMTWKKDTSGQKIKGALTLFKDLNYEFELTNEGKVQRPSIKTSSHDENSQILIDEEKLTVNTPYSVYVWNKTVTKIGENVKAHAYLSYENLKGKSDWMRSILPPSFWENDQKASLKAQLHWKKPEHNTEGVVTRQTDFQIDIPRYLMTLGGDSYEAKFRSQINVNLARKDKNRGELDSFLNFTSDWWDNEDKEAFEKVVRVWNITIPRRSWSLSYQSLKEEPKYHHEVKFRRAVMKPKDQSKSDYVGWWSKEVSDRFILEEQEVKLAADNEWLTLTDEELVERYPSVKKKEIEGLRNGVLVSDIVLKYPFRDATQSLAFDGNFIYSSGAGIFRFQKDFDMVSSYNNLKLTSHSVYTSGTEDGTDLTHSSYFTHLGTETKAYNTIHYTSKRVGLCRHRTFKHDIRSHFFDLSTDAVHRCENEDDDLYTLRLTINTNSSKWNMLDIKLDQIVEDISSDYSKEEMTTTHATGTIHVDAEWHKHPKHHQKRVTLCSKDGNCPNAELFLENFHDGRSIVKFSLPNRNNTQITYERKMSSEYKNMDVEIGYFDDRNGKSDLLSLTAELIARNYHVWKGTLNANTYAKVKDLVMSGYETLNSAVIDIATDKKHPLNDILKPALEEETLYDYWKGLKRRASKFISNSWDEIYEIFYTVEVFAEPAYNVLVNTITNVNEVCMSAYNSVKEKSVTIWAINYFELPYYLHQGFTNLPHAIGELLNQLALGEENILHFKFITGKLVRLASFLEWPSIAFYPSDLVRILTYETEGRTWFNEWGTKLAMIFGPTHVYTFDGHLYDVAPYPHKDCLFLLAHDVHRSLFTVLSSETGLHVLFPEMSITINDQNEVFINGSQQPSPLPVEANNGKVTVKRGDVIEIWSPSLSVICRSEDFLCVFKLSDYHAGGIIGLLGNADEHSTNDYTLPTGNVSSDLSDFIKMYEVSGKSTCQNIALRSPQTSYEERQVCLEKFGSICSFEYEIRDKFMEACMSDVKDNHGPCFAASALSALCHIDFVPSRTDCNVKKQEKETVGRNLEVVLVVQQSKYFSADKASVPVKGIESLVNALEEKFKDSGYASVKYSLVGFGGNGVRFAPTVHSSSKDLWLSADSVIEDVLKTLEFKGREESDAVQALKYSLEELGRDTFNSKIVIVITAKDKQVAEKPVLDFIQEQLEKNGITLYTLSSYPSIEKGKKVFGVRADGLIFPAQSKDGDAYLDYPRGNLAKLTSSTRGSVFLSKFLRENQPPAFFAEFAQEVWAKVNREAEKCRSCQPVASGWWWYKQECSIVRC